MKKPVINLQARPVEKIWGGTQLKERFSRHRMSGLVGESWEVHGELLVKDGIWAGQTLNQLTDTLGPELLGTRCGCATEFPLLTKWLDCQDWLSVQVHPDDKTAKELTKKSGARGKSESWYVHKAADDARVIHGLKDGSSASELFLAEGEEILSLLKRQALKEGDFLTTPPGTVHALGPGLLIYEVQQSSDLTYRIYDWGRERRLHPTESEAAIATSQEEKVPQDRGTVVGELKVLTPHFAIELIEQSSTWEVDEGSFEIIVGLGEDTWCCGHEIPPGSAILLPAGCGAVDLAFDGGQCLRVRLP